MKRYHLAHIIPHPRLYGFNGFAEVIDTVAWGLERLGHRITRDVNKCARLEEAGLATIQQRDIVKILRVALS